ncbi:MAG: hypothetical protein WBF48_13350 [Halarcobacter sp.]
MLTFVIIFFIVGVVIAMTIKDNKKAFSLMIGLSILCGIFYLPMWGLVSFGEMAFGYFVIRFTRD